MKIVKLSEPTTYLGRLRREGEFITVPDNYGVPHKEIKPDKKLQVKRAKQKLKKNETKQDKLQATT